MSVYKDSFEKMIAVPVILSNTILQYKKEIQRLDEDYKRRNQENLDHFTESEQRNSQEYQNARDRAELRLQNWQKRISNIEDAAKEEEDRIETILGKIIRSEIPVSIEDAMTRLQDQTNQRLLTGKDDDNKAIISLCQEADRILLTESELIEKMRRQAALQKEQEIRAAEDNYINVQHENTDLKACRERKNERIYYIGIEHAEDAFIEGVEEKISPDLVKKDYEEMMSMQPYYELFEPADRIPEGILFGYIGYDVTDYLSDVLMYKVIMERFSYIVLRREDRHVYMTFPYGHRFESSKFSTLIEFERDYRQQAVQTLRNLVLNLFMSIPVNRCWCTFLDPVSTGDTFAVFNPLGQMDESGQGDERIIDSRVWFTEEEIEQRLKLINDHIGHIIKIREGKYENIIDYNNAASFNREPFRFLFIMDFPKNFTPVALKYLESIIDNGPANGVFTIIAADKAAGYSSWESIRNKIKNVISSSYGILRTEEKTREGKLRYFPLRGPVNDQSAVDIIREIRKEVGKTVAVPYKMVSDNIPENPDYWFHKSARDGISVPIGLEGADHIVNIDFGNKYGTYAAMIQGNSGSGKSMAIYTIIMGLLFNYSPEDVQIYYLDFNEGIRSRSFADHNLPNFKVISVATEPEFGLAVLNHLMSEMENRGREFRAARVAELEDYWNFKALRGEKHGMPRLVIIFDEIQELMHDEADPVVKQCAGMLKDLVNRAAHAYGIHLILVTQTFENVKGLDNGVYSNIDIRIALKGQKEASEIILGSGNEIIEQLGTYARGQACFNNRGGLKDYNRIIQFPLIQPGEQKQWVEEICQKQAETMILDLNMPRILLADPEDNPDNPLARFAEYGQRPSSEWNPAYRMYIGEDLKMVNTFFPELKNRRGQNILLVGNSREDKDLSRMFVGYSALSLLYEQIRLKGVITGPYISVFDLNGNTAPKSEDYDMLDRIVNNIPWAFRVYPPSMLLEGLQRLYNELPSGRQQFVIFYGLNRAAQLTDGSFEGPVREMLEELFARGPENGMNFIVSANAPEIFLDKYAGSLQEFDHRLVYGMDHKEYKRFIEKEGPENLKKMNAVYFNKSAADRFGAGQKVRMYGRPREEWINKFLDNVKKYVRQR